MDRLQLLSALCQNHSSLRAVADAEGNSAQFAAVTAAARRGDPLEEPLRRAGLLSVIRAGGSRGFQGDGPEGGPVELGFGEGRLAVGDYRCPEDVCDRIARPRAGEPRPECSVFRRALRFEQA
ncbi:hypothetical protein GCM10009830_20670 [Glycomyces endophyticus]|uniref:Uncharacterized protein n=1 Tax=Glycomyces endophyticus TaxID=480996 RepID=A0ABP4SK17_9ACTN